MDIVNELRSTSDTSIRNTERNHMEIGNYITTGVMLGRGAFGTVELAQDKRNPIIKVAIKCISKQNIIRENMGNQVSKEVSILKNLKHPNIVRIEQVLMSSDYLYICMEYIDGGELFAKLTTGTLFSEETCKKYMIQLCDALQYCHGLNVCHRDIKPQNILIDNKDNIKLVDFGFASIMEIDTTKNSKNPRVRSDSGLNIMDEKPSPEEEMKRSMEAPSVLMKDTHTICGTALYMAPEIMTRNTYMGDKVDIWALGTVCYFVMTGNVPFKAVDMKREHYITPLNLSECALDFLKQMLNVVPEKRWSARNLLNHEWLKSIKRVSATSSTDSTKILRQESFSDDDSSESDEEIELGFEFETEFNVDEIIDKIIYEVTEHEWSAKQENGGKLKMSKLDRTGMNMVIIYVEKQKTICNICIKDGSAMRAASKVSKLELEELIKCAFRI